MCLVLLLLFTNYLQTDVLKASGIVPSNASQKRRAVTDPEGDGSGDDDDDVVHDARVKALEVRSLLDYQEYKINDLDSTRRSSMLFGKRLQP